MLLPGTTDFIVWYARDIDRVKFRRQYREKEYGGEGAGKYDQVELPDGERRSIRATETESDLPNGSRVFRYDNLLSQSMGREKGERVAE